MLQMLKWTSLATAGLLFVGVVGCNRETTTKTEVKEKPFGGTEVEKTEVIENGDKVKVRKTETEYDRDGAKKKVEIEEKPPGGG